jgi:hypothetical protein
MKANAFITRDEAQINIVGAVGAVLALIVAAAVMIISVVMLQGFSDSADMTTYNSTTHTGDRLQPSLASITTSTESAMGLSGTLLIVIIGVAILSTLMGVFVLFRM